MWPLKATWADREEAEGERNMRNCRERLFLYSLRFCGWARLRLKLTNDRLTGEKQKLYLMLIFSLYTKAFIYKK